MGCKYSRPEDAGSNRSSSLSPQPEPEATADAESSQNVSSRPEVAVSNPSPAPAPRATAGNTDLHPDIESEATDVDHVADDVANVTETHGSSHPSPSLPDESVRFAVDLESPQAVVDRNSTSPKTKNDSDQRVVEKWTRRNIMALYDGQPYSHSKDPKRIENWAECDRIFIALHRVQTEGRVGYRRLLGMHGGGGGTSDEAFREILTAKMKMDIDTHYNSNAPDGGTWPNPVPNCPPPAQFNKEDDNYCFVYTFCWHAEPEFIMWHRPLMAEFERMLQEYDPKEVGHDKKDSLGAPYWSWEGWDGLTLPQVIDNQFYVLKTNRWEEKGFPKGSSFPNPFHRWFAPVSVEDQIAEKFPDILNDHNATKRASAFHDSGSNFDFPWELVSVEGMPSMKDVVATALSTPSWYHFCTMKPHVGGGNYSIENAHNKFHNHVGGLVMGGIEGSTVQKTEEGAEFTGTMTQNQSIFDPIFFLHHCNVDRQLYSWQRTFADSNPANMLPTRELMKKVLYPWTKPKLLWEDGKLSYNTETNPHYDATFEDWWDYKALRYEYDDYLPTEPVEMGRKLKSGEETFVCRVKISFDAKKYKGGEYALMLLLGEGESQRLLGTISVLVGGGVCAHCASRAKGMVSYKVHCSADITDIDGAKAAMLKENLQFTRNGEEIDIDAVYVEHWELAEMEDERASA